MHAIITELDSESSARVEQIRSAALAACGGDPAPMPWPLHLSWQGAEAYQLDEAEERMRMIARTTAPIVTRIAGVGVFTGPEPVVYLPVTRTPELAALNETMWEALRPLTRNPNAHYSPEQWVPHVTILYASAAMTEAITCLVNKLITIPLDIEVRLDHIYMGYFDETSQGISFRFPLLGVAGRDLPDQSYDGR